MNTDLLLLEIEQTLDRLIAERACSYSKLFSAARYTLLAESKRLRPLITLLIIQLLGGDYKIGLEPACALEIIHTYSLIHDDLPSMDNDMIRRGKPTLHRVYPEGHAILTGDFLLTIAFEILSRAPHLTDRQRVRLIQTAATCSGASGMIGGQIIDLYNVGEFDLEELYALKTGALFQAAFTFGGIIASASEKALDELQQLGRDFGILFQAADDLDDAHHEKQAYQLGMRFYERVNAAIHRLPFDVKPIHQIIEKVWHQKTCFTA